MHAPSLHKWHPLAHSIDFVKHHQKLSEALLVLLLVGLMYHIASLPALEFGREAAMPPSTPSLTLFANPASAHEYALREEYITEALDRLLQALRIERTYAVVYDYAESPLPGGVKSQIFEIFEVVEEGFTPSFGHFQGMSRMNWLYIQQDRQFTGTLSHGWWQSHGFELKDERGRAIGYIGFERREEQFQDREIARLRETAAEVERGLLAPLAAL